MKKIIVLFLGQILLFWSFQLFAQNGVSMYDLPPGYSNIQLSKTTSIFANDNDDVWVGFATIGLGQFSGGAWQMYDSTNSCLPSNNIKCITKYSTMMAVGTANGLVLMGGGCGVFNTSNSGLPANNIRCLSSYGGKLYIGTDAGIGIYNGQNWTTINHSNSGLLNDTIVTLHANSDGLMVSSNAGLQRFNINTTWTSFIQPGMGIIKSIARVSNNEYWLKNLSNYAPNTYILHNNIIKKPSVVYPEIHDYMINSSINVLQGTNNMVVLIKPGNAILLGNTISNYISPVAGNYLITCMNSNNKLFSVSSNNPLSFCKLYILDINAYQPVISSNHQITIDNFKYLNINQVKLGVTCNETIIRDKYSISNYNVPYNSINSTLVSSTFWIAGKEENSNNWKISKGSESAYYSKYLPGPLRLIDGKTDSLTSAKFEKICKLNRIDIENFIFHYNAGNVQNGSYSIPETIASWPGNGPNGYDTQLAPFVDVNNDGIYNPYHGDYPKIKGDQMLWWVVNDYIESPFDTNRMGIELKLSAYAYKNDNVATEDSIINYITFLETEIVNRSNINFDSVFIGNVILNSLGNKLDDYNGSCVNRSFYSYNADSYDDTYNFNNLIYGYQNCPPIQSIVLIKDAENISSSNSKLDGYISYKPGEGDPGMPIQQSFCLPLLKNTWPYDLSEFRFGGNGIYYSNTTTNIPSTFMYPYTSDPNHLATNGIDPGFIWSEYTPGPGLPANNPGAKYSLGRLGPYTFAPGEKKSVVWAFVTHFWPCNDTITLQMEKTCAFNQKLIDWYDNDNFPSGLDLSTVSTQNEGQPGHHLTIFPNPFAKQIYINFQIEKSTRFSYRILDIAGRELINKNASNYQPGNHNISVDLSHLSNGVYLCETQINDKKETKILVKSE